MSREQKARFDFHFGFNVSTDIRDFSDGRTPTQYINIGNFGASLTEYQAQYMWDNCIPDKTKARINDQIDRQYKKEKEHQEERHVEAPGNKRQRKQSGYIYVIEAAGFYKIGRASQLGSRIKSHQTSNPNEVTLYKSKFVQDCINCEKELHKIFNDKLERGEWFKLDKSDLEQIDIFLKGKD